MPAAVFVPPQEEQAGFEPLSREFLEINQLLLYVEAAYIRGPVNRSTL